MRKKIETNREVYDEVKKLGYSNLVASIVGNRIKDPLLVKGILTPTIDVVPSLDRLLDAHKAANIIYTHLIAGGNIVAITDSDSDGVSSAAIIYRSIIDYFNHDVESLHVLVNERLYGNGVNDEMIKRTLAIHKERKVDLVITADHGSADDVRFGILKKEGVGDIVVTDHHLLPKEGELEYSDAFVNPQRDNDTFSVNISGCHVIYLVMTLVYDLFKNNGHRILIEDNMRTILPIMTNTILSDQMDMRDPINRYYLKEGLHELSNSLDIIWVAARELLDLPKVVTEETISFMIAPLLNAANRTGKAYLAYEFLVSRDIHDAIANLKVLIKLNNERKKTESTMLAIANAGVKLNPYSNSIVTLLPEGLGVAGLISNTLGDRLQVPAFTFVEGREGNLVGSGRGIVEGIDLKGILDTITKEDPTIIIKSGGHKGAAGCTIRSEKIREFMAMFDKLAEATKSEDGVVNKYDIEVPFEYIGDNLYDEIQKAGPYGRGYDRPTIKTDIILEMFRYIGKPPMHAILKIYNKERTMMHEAFFPKSAMIRLMKYKQNISTILFTLGKKRYLGKTTVSPTISSIGERDE